MKHRGIKLTEEELANNRRERNRAAYRKDPEKFKNRLFESWVNKAKKLHECPDAVSREQLEQEAINLRREYRREYRKKCVESNPEKQQKYYSPEKRREYRQRSKLKEYYRIVSEINAGVRNGVL